MGRRNLSKLVIDDEKRKSFLLGELLLYNLVVVVLVVLVVLFVLVLVVVVIDFRLPLLRGGGRWWRTLGRTSWGRHRRP